MALAAHPRPAVPWRLPGQCEVCRSWSPGPLCEPCITRFAAHHERCRSCGLVTAAGVERCGECLLDPPPFVHTCCAVDYGFPWDRLISDFKFQGRSDLAAALAGLMQRAHAHDADGQPAPDRLLPVPLSPTRLAERGYNQAWELARRLGRGLRVPASADLLQRIVDTTPQAGLSREERLHNLRAAFIVLAAARSAVTGRHLVLVDDVMTTGATARQAATALLQAGAARVDLWVVARTPAA